MYNGDIIEVYTILLYYVLFMELFMLVKFHVPSRCPIHYGLKLMHDETKKTNDLEWLFK